MEPAEVVRGERSLVISAREDLGEGKCGDWTGLQIDEQLRASALWRQMETQPSTARYPGGESVTEMQMRMVMALEAIRRTHGGETIAVVSHADPLRSAIAFYLGLHLDMFQRMQIHPASISEIEFSGARHQVVRVNDVAHYA
jgi:probable phosphoglycerate mutase